MKRFAEYLFAIMVGPLFVGLTIGMASALNLTLTDSNKMVALVYGVFGSMMSLIIVASWKKMGP